MGQPPGEAPHLLSFLIGDPPLAVLYGQWQRRLGQCGGSRTSIRRAHSSMVKDAIYVLGGLAVVVFFVVRQRRSDRFRERSLLFPIGLGIYGVVLLTSMSEHHALTVASAVLLILSMAASIGFGVIRGRTIELFTRGGELWERASWTTIGVGWGGLFSPASC